MRAANDASTACIGAHAGADGGLVIAGTGSAAIARVKGRETIIGGRGFTLGDDGSGAHIGLDAAARGDARLRPPRAGERAHRRHHRSLRRGSGRDDALGARRQAGRFRRLRAASSSGAPPRAIRSRSRSPPAAARAIGALTRGAVALGAERVALVGGAGEALRPYLEPEIAALLTAPLYDATDGAILLVGGAIAPQREAAQ